MNDKPVLRNFYKSCLPTSLHQHQHHQAQNHLPITTYYHIANYHTTNHHNQKQPHQQCASKTKTKQQDLSTRWILMITTPGIVATVGKFPSTRFVGTAAIPAAPTADLSNNCFHEIEDDGAG
jgi:hypothetical protein